MSSPRHVVFLQTHPVQYMAPWFRHVAATRRDLALTVLYASTPLPAQQGAAFGETFSWDVPLTDGYAHEVLEAPRASHRFDDASRRGVDAPGLEAALARLRPDAVVVPGWHSAFYRRGIRACRRAGVPVLYRGDSSALSAPPGWRRPLWRLATRRRLAAFDAWLSVGSVVREHLVARGAPDALVFDSPWAVDNAFFAEGRAALAGPGARADARRALGGGDDDLIVACVGRLIDRKRPLDAVGAVARLGPRAVLAVVGNGPLAGAVRAEAERLGVRLAWRGFVNQEPLRRALAAADCVIVPSAWETWGLVVNEALAAGTPCVATSGVAAAVDLIRPGVSGALAAPGDVEGLARALRDVRDALARGAITAATCQAAVGAHDFDHATDGIVAALARLEARRRVAVAPGAPTRVLALCGGMVEIFGLEQMSFAVLGALREAGADVHCLVNRWGSRRVVDLADTIGAGWSTAPFLAPLRRRPTPRQALGIVVDVARTSWRTWRLARGLGVTHVFAPDYYSVLRSLPALWLLRARGVRVVLRLGNAPEEGRFYRAAWRAVRTGVDHVVANSRFTAAALAANGVSGPVVTRIPNAAPARPGARPSAPRVPGRIVYVGQVIPPKGVDRLLEAVALLVGQGVDATLDVVGPVEGWESPSFAGYRRRVMARAAERDLAGRVRFLGRREDVPALLAAAQVHCAPSLPELREGFGVTVLEAKEAGVPSVVTRSGALPELVAHGRDGWVCESADPVDLAAGLAAFLTDPARAAEAGRHAAASVEAYGRDRFAAAWRGLFGVGPTGTEAA